VKLSAQFILQFKLISRSNLILHLSHTYCSVTVQKKRNPRSLTWSAKFVEDPESSSWSDFELPSRSSITKSMGIFPFKQLMYRWQKLSQSSCTWSRGQGTLGHEQRKYRTLQDIILSANEENTGKSQRGKHRNYRTLYQQKRKTLRIILQRHTQQVHWQINQQIGLTHAHFAPTITCPWN